MRVITGAYKGRKLEAPVGKDIRPTSDKVKESMFNILMNETWGRVFCDLFCGTGGLGIEALSRGAKRCYFCDNSRESLRLARKNIEHCGAEDKAILFQGDFRRALDRIGDQIDVFLLDPPYHEGIYEECISLIDSLDLLSPEGIIVAEHDAGTDLPDVVGKLQKEKTFRYGKTILSLYRRAPEPEEEI